MNPRSLDDLDFKSKALTPLHSLAPVTTPCLGHTATDQILLTRWASTLTPFTWGNTPSPPHRRGAVPAPSLSPGLGGGGSALSLNQGLGQEQVQYLEGSQSEECEPADRGGGRQASFPRGGS